VNGSNSPTCPTGPAAPGSPACDEAGETVKAAVRRSAFGVLGSGVDIPTPEWFPNNARGSTVRVTASYSYQPIVPLVPLPEITVAAESTLVVNN
jgi:hypothetical protein